MIELGKYIGVPFLDGGRDFRGWDCWGLVRTAFAEGVNIELPSYAEISAHELIRIARQIETATDGAGPWVETGRAFTKPFDVAVMYRRRYPTHVGLVIERDRMLHVVDKQQTVMIPMTSPLLTAFTRVKFYRHKTLSEGIRR